MTTTLERKPVTLTKQQVKLSAALAKCAAQVSTRYAICGFACGDGYAYATDERGLVRVATDLPAAFYDHKGKPAGECEALGRGSFRLTDYAGELLGTFPVCDDSIPECKGWESASLGEAGELQQRLKQLAKAGEALDAVYNTRTVAGLYPNPEATDGNVCSQAQPSHLFQIHNQAIRLIDVHSTSGDLRPVAGVNPALLANIVNVARVRYGAIAQVFACWEPNKILVRKPLVFTVSDIDRDEFQGVLMPVNL